MAIVKNGAAPYDSFDVSRHRINRTNGGSPNSALTPVFSGELVYDTTNNLTYKAYGTTNTSWEKVDRPRP